MSDFKKDFDILSKKYGKLFIDILSKNIINMNKSASGKLVKSLKADVKPVANGVVIVINSEKYLEYVDKGRKPGKFPPIAPLVKWCSIRGIPKSSAFAIAQSIFKFGIKPTNVISKSVKKFEDVGGKKIEKDMISLIESEVKKIIKSKKR